MSRSEFARAHTAPAVGFAAAALFFVPAAALAQSAPEPAPQAVWTLKQQRFIYQGFTTHYTCDGLRNQVREALLDLGARPDLKVRESGCSSPSGRPDPFPAVNITMQVLTPTAASTAAQDAPPVPAHWMPITLKLDRDPLNEAGDCELLEQIKQTLLPLFTTRNIEYVSTCVPHQLTPGGTRLAAEVLVADPPPATAPAAAAR